MPAVVAINRFPTDSEKELEYIREQCAQMNVPVALSEVWDKGGKGGIEMAQAVLDIIEKSENNFRFIYQDDMPIKDKINAVATKIYGADGVDFTPGALKEINKLESLGFGNMPVCMAKTQYSFSDDPKKLGWPKDFRITVRNIKVSAGAGFIVALTGDIMTMPGLPKIPAAGKNRCG